MNYKKIIFLFFVVLVSGCVTSVPEGVEWVKSYGGPSSDDRGIAIAVNSMNNIVTIGNVEGRGTLIIYDSQGNELLLKQIGPTFQDMTLDSQDNIIVVAGTADIDIIKIDSSGNILWQRKFDEGYDVVGAVEIDSEDNIIVGGKLNHVLMVLKYDGEGNLIWRKVYEDELALPGEQLSDLRIDSKNNIIVTGWNTHLIKLDSEGEKLWSKNIEITIPRKLQLDTQDNIILVGRGDNKLVKFNPSGETIWRISKDPELIDSFGVTTDSQNNIFSVEWTGKTKGNTNIKVIKYDSNGNLIETKEYDGGGFDHGMDIKLDSNESIYVTGFTNIGRNYDLITVKFK